MASNPRKRVRYTFDVHFTSLEEKEIFQRRLKGIRELLTPSGCPSIDNNALMNAFMGAIEAETSIVTERNSSSVTKSFMRNGGRLYQYFKEPYSMLTSFFKGVFTDDGCSDDDFLFIAERYRLTDLINGLASPCDCGLTRSPWIIESLVQVL